VQVAAELVAKEVALELLRSQARPSSAPPPPPPPFLVLSGHAASLTSY